MLTHATKMQSHSKSHGPDFHPINSKEFDEAYVHTAAVPDVLILQQVLAASNSYAGQNAPLSNSPEDDDDDDERLFPFHAQE